MIWSWWVLMGLMGLVLGVFAAWTTGAARAFMQTLAVPIAMVLTRLAFPLKDSSYYVMYLLLDLAIVAVAAFLGEHYTSLRLGSNEREGYRSDERYRNDTVGH